MMHPRKQKTYEVEEVVGKRTENGVVQYRIKWVNYKTRSWEDAKNCDCREAIAKYEKKQKNNNSGKSSQSSTPTTSRKSSKHSDAAQAAAGDGTLAAANLTSNAIGRATRRGVDSPSIDGSTASANQSSIPSTARMSSRRTDAAQADPEDEPLATTAQPAKSTFIDRLTRRFSGAGGDSVLSADDSTASVAHSSNSSSARAATRGKSAADIPNKVDETSSSTDARRSSSLNDELAELSKAHHSINTPKGQRKRGAPSTPSVVPAKILKAEDLKGIKIWTESAYCEWAKKKGIDGLPVDIRPVDEKEHEKFLGAKIIGGLVAHFPHGKNPYYVIKTEASPGKKQTDVADGIHAVDCLLAVRLFPKAVAAHCNFLARSSSEGNQERQLDEAGPSASQ